MAEVGDVATIQIELVSMDGQYCDIRFPSGQVESIPTHKLIDIEWGKPPWKPENGKPALYRRCKVLVVHIGQKTVMIRWPSGGEELVDPVSLKDPNS